MEQGFHQGAEVPAEIVHVQAGEWNRTLALIFSCGVKMARTRRTLNEADVVVVQVFTEEQRQEQLVEVVRRCVNNLAGADAGDAEEEDVLVHILDSGIFNEQCASRSFHVQAGEWSGTNACPHSLAVG